MWTFLIFSFIFMWLATSTLSLITFFDEGCCTDGEDLAFSSFISILLGLIWPITVWVSLVRWYADGDNPAWVEALSKLFSLIKKITHR